MLKMDEFQWLIDEIENAEDVAESFNHDEFMAINEELSKLFEGAKCQR